MSKSFHFYLLFYLILMNCICFFLKSTLKILTILVFDNQKLNVLYIPSFLCHFLNQLQHLFAEIKHFHECYSFALMWRREKFFLNTNLQGAFKKFRGQLEELPSSFKHGDQGCPCFAQGIGHGVIDLTLILVLFSCLVCFLQEFPDLIFHGLSPRKKKV